MLNYYKKDRRLESNIQNEKRNCNLTIIHKERVVKDSGPKLTDTLLVNTTFYS
jgi:hypothetical protein